MIGILRSNLNGIKAYENISEQDMFELFMSEVEEIFDMTIYTVEAAFYYDLPLPKYSDWWCGEPITAIKRTIAESIEVELYSPSFLPSGTA